MNSTDLRQKFLKFFESKGHKIIPSASLVPANDSTVLFTTAGMHPLVPFLLGQEHPLGKRLTNAQKCLRTDDMEEVGDEIHNTFFEMLGNWSLGDYWKSEAIKWAYEFLTDKKWLALDPRHLAVTVFEGDTDAPRDQDSVAVWKSLGMGEERIAFLGKKDNWWGPPGPTGPCGPDTEIFYWTGGNPIPDEFHPEDKRWVEIWNNVFMEYEKTAEGKFVPLAQRNVDTGMGLERMAAILEGKDSIYETELFKVPFWSLFTTAGLKEKKSARIIADHLRAITFLLGDGVVPSNKDRGYVLRRLIRRVLVIAEHRKVIPGLKLDELVAKCIKFYKAFYRELSDNHQKITEEFEKERVKFSGTLERGLREFDKLFPPSADKPSISDAAKFGQTAFDLYQTYGFPVEVLEELLLERGYVFDKSQFEKTLQSEIAYHQELSRTAAAGVFKGGLASHSDNTVRLHTATHLLNAALRKVLGENVWQKGSNITDERTRFDFTQDVKMTDEQKSQVEKLVNDWVARDLTVKKEIMSLEEARKLSAIGVFGEKYADQVSVYTIFDPKTEEVISREFCGGPHVKHTGVIGKFKIAKEEAVSAGVRRIKAVLE